MAAVRGQRFWIVVVGSSVVMMQNTTRVYSLRDTHPDLYAKAFSKNAKKSATAASSANKNETANFTAKYQTECQVWCSFQYSPGTQLHVSYFLGKDTV